MNRWRPIAWGVVSVACFIGAIYFWRLGDKWQAQKPAVSKSAVSNAPTSSITPPSEPLRFESTFNKSASTAPVVDLTPPATNAVVAKGTNAFPYRLSNTTKTVGQLAHDSRAILLENALIDSGNSSALAIPDSLKSHGDPGAYIVQASGPMTKFLSDEITAAGATIVSYIPNNAYLVTGTPAVAAELGRMFSVQPWEPYFKVKSSLMPAALGGQGASALVTGVLPGALEQTKAALDKMGVTVLAESRSAFGGSQLTLQNVPNIATVAGLPGVWLVEPSLARQPANDLTRVIMSDSVDQFVPTNYLGLSGSNVLVSVADSWVATNGATVFNPDLPNTTLIGYSNAFPVGFADLEGHATHVGGIIAASGLHSPTNAVGSLPGADFRGKAPASKLFALPIFDPFFTDDQLQQVTAQTNALISNNSWGYGTSDYNLAAASYDQAVRDSLPGMTGAQGLIYVFAAGNSGNGGDNGQGGNPDSLTSPAVAKNVISVGASELPRNITNDVWVASGGCDTNNPLTYTTNKPWALETDSQNEIARFSSRGNVGIGIEGDFGRFKPDVVAPGTFVVSTRSMTWDTNAYYNITNHAVHTYFGDTVQTNALFNYLIFVPCGAVELDMFATSINPLNVNLPIFARNGAKPNFTVFDDVGTNFLAITNISPVDSTWFYSVGNDVTNVPVQYNITSDLISTNSMGDYWDVLRTNLNDQLGSSNSSVPLYRYESGTSMAAPAVAGTLALMEDFFTNSVHYTPSPALMKAMLINGARTINNNKYDFDVQSVINYQGWGLVNLTNSLPIGLTNGVVGASGPMLYQDQSPTNALATGDSRTIFVSVDPNAQDSPLRVTLVWTDPPGNPAAGIKLVNDLDLIVTNLDAAADPTQQPIIYFGNDIIEGQTANFPWDTNSSPNIDNINNVENVYIAPSLGTNYSITVRAHAVNVNAVTSHTNGIVQDYALVISSGNGDITNALTLTNATPITASPYVANLTTVTNQFPSAPDFSGGVLLHQHVGASSPLQGTNTLLLSSVAQSNWGNNGQITLGVSNQWHFYVITNSPGTNATLPFTNAVFATFLPPTLSIPPVGVNATDPNGATRPEADIDLYVARGPNASALTNLDPTVIAAADKSLSRGGTEVITYQNATNNEVFYIGVKSEDQEAAEYAFVGLFALNPFSSAGADGTVNLRGINVPNPIPDGSASKPGEAMTLAVDVMPITIRRVVVTNSMTHENFGDLFGVLQHGQKSSVLNNHSFGDATTNQTFIYEDNDEHDIPGSRHTDYPGSLRNFTGEQGVGLWVLTEQDNAPSHTGQVNFVDIRLDPQQNTNGVVATIQPNSFFYDFIDVPPDATNMTVCVSFLNGSTGPVQLYLRYGDYPTLGSYDYTMTIANPPIGDCLTVSRSDLPPLKPGRYYFGVYNPTDVPQTVLVHWSFGLDPNGVNPTPITPTSPTALLPDDAVTNNTIFITNDQNIVTVNVGVVLQHPRISDLDLTLIAPTGQRILLFENRGGLSATNMGHLNVFTNFFGATSAGDANQNNNAIGPVPPTGTLIIDYQFYNFPDTLDVYDGPLKIYSTGLINGAGTLTIPYNLVNGNIITIVMNQGNNSNPDTQWMYQPRVVTQDYTYLTFTDDTNRTDMPIKFAIPPYDANGNGTNFTLNDFELNTNGEYVASPGNNPTIIPDGLGGWTMTTNDVFIRTNYFGGTNLLSMATNRVSVVTDPRNANTGSNFLALARGSISRTITLDPQRDYDITYRYRGPGIAGWWRGEGNATDSSDPETLGNNGSLIGRFNFPAGEVGQAFAMEDSGQAFEFAGTNTYVQVPQSFSLDVGRGSGFTVEGWINPTNITYQQPMVEWLAPVPANPVVNGQSVSNMVVLAGPFLNRATSHYYYLLKQTNWTTSELWANALGGHLVEVDDANEQNWVYDTFAQFAGSNYTMWIGLTNGTAANSKFTWSTGNGNVVYTNWALGEPTNCPTSHYTAVLSATNGLPGEWTLLDDNGLKCSGAPANKPFGVVEVNQIQTNGVQFWISVTNLANPGNGRLYANIFDTNGVPHEIFSPAGLIQSNVFQHVALTYNTNTGVANLYYNGTNVASTNLGIFAAKTGGDVLIGKDMSRATNNFFWGRMDEMSIYSRFLSPSEIRSIYEISASTTNRNIGKFDPAITPAQSLGEAQVSFGGITNLIFGNNDNWQVQGFSLKTLSNSLPVQITGIEPGVLLDSFSVFQKPPGNLYYLPEQPLQALTGTNAHGNWTLEIRDARTGAISTNAELISWQLQFILQTNIAPPIQLSPQAPGTNTVPPGQIAYFTVFVPSWANNATNILVSATAPVDFLFNQTVPPGTGSPNDVTFLTGATSGSQMISAVPPSTPPLIPGQTYYLAVRNNGTVPSTVVVRVDFNMTTLTDGVPFTSTLGTNDVERPFIFNVSSNASEATFQLLKMSGNADLVLRKGLPLPTLIDSDYGSFSGSNADETIYVLTNSLPVPLSQGPWYLDVVKRALANNPTGSNAVTYTILAKQLTNAPTIISLANRVPLNYTAGPGAALTNFFKFSVTNFPLATATNVGLRFEVFNQSGNGDLTVQTNLLPLAPPFLQSSRLPFNNAEIVLIRTNVSATTNLNADWYLGVPNNETNPISFTILAELETNSFAAFPTAEGSGAYTRGGALTTNVYHVTTMADAGPGSLRNGINTLTNGGTIVFDRFGTNTLSTPLVITNSNLTIAGQTAPGSGVTIVGAPTYIQGAHDVILRYLRFRSGTNASPYSIQFTNTANIIADHISTANGAKDVVGVLNSSNVTVQWSVVGEGLNTTNLESGGSEIRYGSGDVTFHHNLYADNYSGNPTIGEDMSLDFENNVIFNWGLFAGFSTNDLANNPGGLTNFLNYSANYLIAGPNSVITNGAFWSGAMNTWIFQTNNFIDTNKNSILDGANTSWGMFSNQYTPFSHAFDIPPPTAPDEAFIAYERVLDFAGASLEKRDQFDRGVVQRVRLQPAGTNGQPMLAGMSAWWKAENNANDSVGGNNGVFYGNISYVNGEAGQAFNFDGASYVKIPDGPDLRFTNVMSGDAWIKLTNYSGFNEVFSKLDTGPNNSWTLGIDPTTHKAYFSCDASNSISTYVQVFTSSAIPLNNWTHLAAVIDGTSAKIYMNGILSGSLPWTQGIHPGTAPLSIGCTLQSSPTSFFKGQIDEVSLYKRALSDCEIAAIYNSGTNGKTPILITATNGPAIDPFTYVDVDRDGIPDFWEISLNENPTNFSPNLDRDGDGYTDLEEYLNWLGAPHALTVTNQSTNVDLYVLSGNTGSLQFGVANGTNGTVYLTNSNPCAVSGNGSVAVFTPNTNYSGFGSFTYMVTNLDTRAYFGPVTVSVFISAVPITNAGLSTNIITFTNTMTNQMTFEMVPYIFTNGAIDSDPAAILTYTISTVIDTNATLAHGWPLANLSLTPSPTIDPNTGVITWTPTEAQGPGVYTITTVATDNGLPPAHATNVITLTVNEVNRPPVFVGTPPNQTNSALTTFTISDPATDPDIPANPLTYTVLNPPAGMTEDPATGVITWTPTAAQAGTFIITNVVTDTNAYALSTNTLSATNFFTIVVNPAILPYVFTQPAQAVTGASAKLNGMATPNGLPATAWFEWGTNTLYGNSTAPITIGNGYNVVYVPTVISGLSSNVPYHYRLVSSNAVGIAYGFDQIFDEANVVAWGADYVKQVEVPAGLSNVVAIAGAYDHSLALRDAGTVVAWGDNTFSQTNVPPGLNNILAVAGGEYSSMALRNNGTVAAWGGNILSVTNVPPGLNNVVMIAGGTYASLALRNNGSVVSWGANFFNLTNLPAGLNNVVEVAGGSYHSLAIRNDGSVVAWGDNSAGQTNVPPNATNIVAIAGGNYHSLALRGDGTVVAWGDNSAGQTNVPPGLSNVVAVAAGGFHSLALKNDGTIVGWGDNTAGQARIPIGLSNVVAISSGYFHSLALTPTLPPTNAVLNITNGVPDTNSVLAGSITFYRVDVPVDADAATNSLLFAINGPLNVWYTTNVPPTVGSATDFELLTNAFTGTSVVDTASSPQLMAGKTYYLGLQNTNAFAVSYVVEVDFHLVPILPLTNGVPETNAIPSGGLTFYEVDVPTNADFATNLLFSGTGPLDVWFSTNVPPTITNLDDILLIGNAPSGTSVLSTNGTPQLEPGTTYYLGVHNTNTTSVTYGIGVNFHFPSTNTAPSTNTIPITSITHTNINGKDGYLLVWYAPTNDFFQVQWSPGLLQPWNTFTNVIGFHTFQSPTNSEFEFFDDGSQTGGTLGSGRIYRLILLGTLPPTVVTGGSPITNTAAPGTVTFYQVNTPTNANYATNSLITSTLPVNMWITTNVPPSINNSNDLILIPNSTNGSYTTAAGSPFPSFVPGSTYYLGIENTNTSSATYTIQVDFHLLTSPPSTNPIPITSITHTTNGYLLVWYAPASDLFQVQWSPGLFQPWNTFTNIIGYHTFMDATNSEFEFLDDGSQTGGFGSGRIYRLILLNSSAPTILPLTNSVPASNTVPASAVTYYQVNVPTNADYGTNLLLSATGPLNVWFSTNYPPTVGNADDFSLVSNATSGASTLNPSSTPKLVPGSTYYLGVQNTGASSVDFAVRVDFRLFTNPPSTNPVPISSITQTNINGTNAYLLVWHAPASDLFQVQWSPGLLQPWTTFTNIIGYHTFIYATNSEFEFIDDGSQTGGSLGSGRLYRLILLNGATLPTILPLTNGVPSSNSVPSGTVTYYQVNVPTNADYDTNLLLSATVPVNVWFSTNYPPTVGNANDSLLITNLASGSSALNPSGTPKLVPGSTYYLGVQNTNAGAVDVAVRVDFHLVSGGMSTNPIPISSITITNINGTNDFLLVWFAPTNDLFQVQWSSSFPPTWFTFTNIISFTSFTSPTNGKFMFLDDGSQSGPIGSSRYYRLLLYNGSSPSVTVVPLANGVPVNFTTGAGQTNFFSFDITDTNASVLFEVYNQNGNGDLIVQRGSLPTSTPYFTNSANPGTNFEQIVLRTNASLPNLNATSWFLGVPNLSASAISYTIRAVLPTNGILVSGQPIGTTSTPQGGTNVIINWGPTVLGEKYEIRTNANLVGGSWGALTDIVATSTSMTYTDPIRPSGPLYYRVVQVP